MARLCLSIITAALFAVLPAIARAQDATAADVHFWIGAYSVWYAGPSYSYSQLVEDVERVAACESHFATDVINGRRRGRLGEIGTGQFLPGPDSIWHATPQARAGYPVTDPEANVAGLVWSISRNLGPGHWVFCWRSAT